jgi:hypothetical protein
MAEKSGDTRECPYCKEEVKAEAILCKHCGSRLTPEKPTHGGICPYCKESINPEATRCKHCRSSLLPGGSRPNDCGCGGDTSGSPATAFFSRLGPGSGLSPSVGGVRDFGACFDNCFNDFVMCDILARQQGLGYPTEAQRCLLLFQICVSRCQQGLPT